MKHLKVWENFSTDQELKDKHEFYDNVDNKKDKDLALSKGMRYDSDKMEQLLEKMYSEQGRDILNKFGLTIPNNWYHSTHKEKCEMWKSPKGIVWLDVLDDGYEWVEDNVQYTAYLGSGGHWKIEDARPSLNKIGLMVDDDGDVYGYKGETCFV